MAKDLAYRVAEAARALPRRGLEVSGLLLGEQVANEIGVKSLQPLACGYPDGPAFRMSEGELQEVLQQVEDLNQVVGIYRSRTDGSLDLDDQDKLLLKLLGRPRIPVLLIRQQRAVPAEGRPVWGSSDVAGSVTSAGDIFPIKLWLTGAWPPPELVLATSQPLEEKQRNLPRPWIAVVASALLLVPICASG
ncbi:MAG: hypothetical protein WKF37_12275 [Bryobacteraceae bacterium]